MKDIIQLKIAPKDIDLLTKIMEAYEHLGVVSTVDRKAGLLIVTGTEDTIPEVLEVLANAPLPVEIITS
ncbi:MAG: DUF4911 domain-containing protein [Syntrophomonadaceae bacterium]|jgi:hypothetical protein